MTKRAAPSNVISETGTKIQLGLGIIVLGATATGVVFIMRGMAKVDASSDAVKSLQVAQEKGNEQTSKLNETMVALQGSVSNLAEKIGYLQADGKQGEREAQERAGEIVRLQSEYDGIKDRVSANEATLRAIEQRILSVEIKVSATQPVAPQTRPEQ